MLRLPLIVVGCFLIASGLGDIHVDATDFNLMDSTLLDGVDEICHEVKDMVDKTVGQQDTLFLRIVEYTALSMHSHSIFPGAADSLLASKHFDSKRKTVIFVHGFTDSPGSFSGQSFAAAYKIHGHYNILALDSSKLMKMFYLRSSALVKYIGEALAVVLHDLVKKGVAVENIHLVGHSLGAHVAGFAGKSFKVMNDGKKLPRITGLDPAGPCFFRASPDQRLDKDDADFVNVIHTNPGEYGINKTIGHADFYPNGQSFQPGCIESACSHSRVWKYYEESVVRPNAFVGSRCNSWNDFVKKRCVHGEHQIMGMGTPSDARGVYYLRTNLIPPYGLGVAGTKPFPLFASQP